VRAAPSVRPARAGRRTLTADAVVVGSGAGGGPVACELAEAGLDVVVLEEGERHPPGELTARPRDMLSALYRDAGQIVTVGNPPIVLPLGRTVGGSTLVNSGTCFRTPEPVLERWRRELGLEIDLSGPLDRVERIIGVSEVPAELAGRNAAIARRGAEALGWSSGFLRRNARGCVGSGVCAFGCPAGAKQHVGEIYLPAAERAGARVLPGTRVSRVLTERGRASGVEAPGLRVLAPRVIVAAGTIHTPLLLARSGLGSRAWLGRNLSLHPASAVWGLMDEVVDLARGVPQSFYIDEFARDGIMLEGVAGPPDYVAMAVPFAGDRHRELMLSYRQLAQFGLMISDSSRGRVTRWGIRYDLVADDVRRFEAGLNRLAELFWAAGAQRVFLPVGGTPELRRGERLQGLTAGRVKAMAFHPLGTARAAADPARGVVDANLQLHGVRGVYVADGSAVPTALGVNPQVTIMALATRLAFHLLERECPS
jgi:choline dehydrogenase-like flavoprotein